MTPARDLLERAWTFDGGHTDSGWDLVFHVCVNAAGVHWKREEIAPTDYNLCPMASQTHDEFCHKGAPVPMPPALEREVRAHVGCPCAETSR